MKSLPNEMIIITFCDIKNLYLRHRSKIKTVALVCGLAMLAILVVKEPKFLAEATFKQANRQNEIPPNLKDLYQQVLSLSSPGERAQISIMQSNEVMKNVVEQLGMQVTCHSQAGITRLFKRIFENIKVELKRGVSDLDQFQFRHVAYDGEKPLSMYLKVIDGETYQLFTEKKVLIAEGRLGKALSTPQAALTLQQFPSHVKLNRFYALSISPRLATIKQVLKRLDIAPLKTDRNILRLTFTHRDRFLASDVLNQLMNSYQLFLKKENDEVCQIHLDYLEQRQQDLFQNFDRALAEHAEYLKENLIATNGEIGFSQELEMLLKPKELYSSKLFQIDLELGRLAVDRAPIFPENRRKEILARIDQCEMEEMEIQPINIEIENVRKQALEAHLLLECLETGKEIPSLPSLLSDPKSFIGAMLKAPQDTEKKTQLAVYLKSFVNQLEQKRDTLVENAKLARDGLHDFAGLSLELAPKLLTEFNHERDGLQAQLKEMIFLREKLAQSNFELSSFGVVFSDPVINELIHKASSISLLLNDNDNRTAREQERLRESLETQKSFLSQYLFQATELKKLRAKLLSDKIHSLQQETVSLLKSEKGLLNEKLKELNVQMARLPEKWRRESLLKLKKDVNSMMIEGVSQLAESKYIVQNFYQTGARPLDSAIPPTMPTSPRLLLISLFVAIASGFFYYFGILCKNLLKGLPVSFENLKLSGFPVSGAFSRDCNTSLNEVQANDLETLRVLTEFLTDHVKQEGALIAACVGGKYPDYSSPLAELLAMRGFKVLAVHCVFDAVVHPESVPGLWQYLKGETEQLPIRRHLAYDFIPSGSATRHGPEFISSPRFARFLSSVKQQYDIVLIYSSADADKSEGTSLLKVSDVAVVTVQQELKDGLLSFCEWSEKKPVTFVYAHEFI